MALPSSFGARAVVLTRARYHSNWQGLFNSIDSNILLFFMPSLNMKCGGTIVLSYDHFRKRDRQILRYQKATAVEMASVIELALSGPDSTNLSTDMNLTCATIMNRTWSVTTICTPCVPRHNSSSLCHAIILARDKFISLTNLSLNDSAAHTMSNMSRDPANGSSPAMQKLLPSASA